MICCNWSGMKTFAVLLTGTKLLLLVTVFFTTAYSTDAFVSTELQNNMSISILLSIFVIVSTLVYLAYIYLLTGQSARLGFALFGATVSVAGWGTLVATEMQFVGHITGTSLFVASTGIYVLIMFTLNDKMQYIYLAGYAVVGLFALLFVIFDYTDLDAAAAIFE